MALRECPCPPGGSVTCPGGLGGLHRQVFRDVAQGKSCVENYKAKAPLSPLRGSGLGGPSPPNGPFFVFVFCDFFVGWGGGGIKVDVLALRSIVPLGRNAFFVICLGTLYNGTDTKRGVG